MPHGTGAGVRHERAAFRRHELDALLNLAAAGMGHLFALQAEALQK